MKDTDPIIINEQYHGCWWPGTTRSYGSRSHVIDLVPRNIPTKTLQGGMPFSLRWRHNGCDGVSNHQPHDCLLNRLFRRRSKKHRSASLAFERGIHRGPMNSPHKWPVTRKCFHLMTSSWISSDGKNAYAFQLKIYNLIWLEVMSGVCSTCQFENG